MRTNEALTVEQYLVLVFILFCITLTHTQEPIYPLYLSKIPEVDSPWPFSFIKFSQLPVNSLNPLFLVRITIIYFRGL
jgi:hypothetical protein